MKKYIFYLLTGCMLFLYSFASFAEINYKPTEFTTIEADISIPTNGDFYKTNYQIGSAVQDWLKSNYTFSKNNFYYLVKSNNNYVGFAFDQQSYLNMREEDDFLKEWIPQNLPNIVVKDADATTTMRNIYDYILNISDYEVNLPASCYTLTALTTGKISCMGYSNTFEALVEAIPFNSEWKVDWDLYLKPEAYHLNIYTIWDEEHTWNAVELDGIRYYFDLTWADRLQDADAFFMVSAEEFYKPFENGAYNHTPVDL